MRRRAAVAVAALAAAALLPAQPAVAAAKHVGIVVRFPNGATSTACATVGGNGYRILTKGRYSIRIGTSGPYAGFLLQINSQPKSPHPDNTHYWSYWHLVNGAWQYSSSGAGSYTPEAGTVDGWSYVNGTSNAPPPPKRSYAALCGGLDPKPAPPPNPPAAPSTTHHAVAAPPPHPAATTQHASHTVSTTQAAPHPTPTPSHRSPVATASRSATAAGTPSSPPSSTSPASSGAVAAAHVAQPPRQSDAGMPAWGTVLALVVVAVLGAGAWWRLRRQRA